MSNSFRRRVLGTTAAVWALIVFLGAGFRVLADCSSFGLPFTDLGTETTFCAVIAEAYYTGIAAGTSSTTFAPTDLVTREQSAAFATGTLNAALTRGSRRAALGQWWTSMPHWDLGLGTIPVGVDLGGIASDGVDLWVSGTDGLHRIRASDGASIGTWTAEHGRGGVLVAMGRVFLRAGTYLSMLDPAQPPGGMTDVAQDDGFGGSMTFDGSRIWIGGAHAVSIVTPGASIPWSVASVTSGFSIPLNLAYDGTHVWASDEGDAKLKQLDSDGNILSSTGVGSSPGAAIFDGHNIWVMNVAASLSGSTVSVVRATDGTVVKTLTGSGLCAPESAAFDGQNVLIVNGGDPDFPGICSAPTLSVFRAADLSTVAVVSSGFGGTPGPVSTDGINFFVAIEGLQAVGRF